ncbi:MAG: glycosyltransferase family 29 protein [Cypionkella sp.]
MTRLGFYIARTLRQEAPLAAMAQPMAQVMARMTGRVALVGNARSLAASTFGAEIDAADLVIRINRAPMPDPQSHGTRTDVLALATSLDAEILRRLNPALILWMSHKRKRLPWAVASHPGFALPPLADFHGLKEVLNAPPTTGLMMIDLLSRSTATKITLYGFDFFASQSLSGGRTAGKVPHDFAAERGFVAALMSRDPRFQLRKPSV